MRFSPPNRAVARALTNVLGLTTLPEIVRSLTSRSKRLHSRSSVIGLIALHQLLAALRQYWPDFSWRRACTYRCRQINPERLLPGSLTTILAHRTAATPSLMLSILTDTLSPCRS